MGRRLLKRFGLVFVDYNTLTRNTEAVLRVVRAPYTCARDASTDGRRGRGAGTGPEDGAGRFCGVAVPSLRGDRVAISSEATALRAPRYIEMLRGCDDAERRESAWRWAQVPFVDFLSRRWRGARRVAGEVGESRGRHSGARADSDATCRPGLREEPAMRNGVNDEGIQPTERQRGGPRRPLAEAS